MIMCLVALALCGGQIIAALVYLATGRGIRGIRRHKSRAEAMSILCGCLSICIITGTIATGWVRTQSGATLAVGVPVVLALIGLSIYFAQRSSVMRGGGGSAR